MRGTSTSVAVAALLLGLHAVGASKHVSWYSGKGNVTKNLEWYAANPASITGFYLCCGGFQFGDDGSFSAPALAEITSEAQPLLDLGLSAHFVLGITNVSLSRGSWTAGIPAAVQTAVQGNFTGYIVDYEPASNYTRAHAQAYGDFLRELAAALHKVGKELGFDIAGWGILDYWDVYSSTGVDIATSMTPTYSGTNVTLNRDFVLGAISGGMSAAVLEAGIGTMLAPPNTPEWHYNWTQPRLASFASWLSGTAGVSRMSFWRADIDHGLPPSATEPWVFDIAATFLQS